MFFYLSFNNNFLYLPTELSEHFIYIKIRLILKQKLLLVLLLVTFSYQLSAQLAEQSLGFYGSAITMKSTMRHNHYGVGFCSGIFYSDKMEVLGGVAYNFPSTYDTIRSYKNANGVVDYTKYEFKTSIIDAYAGGRYYILGGLDEDLSVFAGADLGMYIMPINTTIENYNHLNHYKQYGDFTDRDFNANYYAKINAGVSLSVGDIFVFGKVSYSYILQDADERDPAFMNRNAIEFNVGMFFFISLY